MQSVMTLFDREGPSAAQSLPEMLRELYGGDLGFPSAENRPYVFGNFVSTLDGVVSFKIAGHSDGSAISGADPGDRFIMGLLRASADAVLVGADTVRDAAPDGLWTPASIYPEGAALFADYRLNALRRSRSPLTVIVTRTGQLDLQREAFQRPDLPVLVVTTAAGHKKLDASGVASLGAVEVRRLDTGDSEYINPQAIVELLRTEYGVRQLLHEGGPTLFGEFLAAGLVDELFLTLAPQIAGRSPQSRRPTLALGTEFSPETAPWFALVSTKQHADYLYLRYRLTATHARQ